MYYININNKNLKNKETPNKKMSIFQNPTKLKNPTKTMQNF